MTVPRLRAALVALFLACAALLNAQAPLPRDVDVKAAYLLNFGRFATWPPSASPIANEFPVCVIGRDPFGASLDATVAGEAIDGKGVVAKRVRAPQEAAGCRILFVGDSEDKQLAAILDVASRAAVLTISDLPGFVDRGGMIQFVMRDRRIRFMVNADAADRAGLTLSSELLRVATDVKREPTP
jgi:hypothetical protein